MEHVVTEREQAEIRREIADGDDGRFEEMVARCHVNPEIAPPFVQVAYLTAERGQRDNPGIPCLWCHEICEVCRVFASKTLEQFVIKFIEALENEQWNPTSTDGSSQARIGREQGTDTDGAPDALKSGSHDSGNGQRAGK